MSSTIITPGISSYLSCRQLRGLQKAGDIVAPANQDFPSFSQTGCIEHVDRVMATTHPEDLAGFKMLMLAFCYTPTFLIELLLKLTDYESKFPNFIGAALRLLGLGVKGVIFSLYYSNLGNQYKPSEKVYEAIDYHVECKPD